MTLHLSPELISVLITVAVAGLSLAIGYIIGNVIERKRWIKASEHLGIHKQELVFGEKRYLVLESDEYEQFLNVFVEE